MRSAAAGKRRIGHSAVDGTFIQPPADGRPAQRPRTLARYGPVDRFDGGRCDRRSSRPQTTRETRIAQLKPGRFRSEHQRIALCTTSRTVPATTSPPSAAFADPNGTNRPIPGLNLPVSPPTPARGGWRAGSARRSSSPLSHPSTCTYGSPRCAARYPESHRLPSPTCPRPTTAEPPAAVA